VIESNANCAPWKDWIFSVERRHVVDTAEIVDNNSTKRMARIVVATRISRIVNASRLVV
jgi:hypothetical protein